MYFYMFPGVYRSGTVRPRWTYRAQSLSTVYKLHSPWVSLLKSTSPARCTAPPSVCHRHWFYYCCSGITGLLSLFYSAILPRRDLWHFSTPTPRRNFGLSANFLFWKMFFFKNTKWRLKIRNFGRIWRQNSNLEWPMAPLNVIGWSCFTSVKVMFLPEFVCQSVCLCVSKITLKIMEGSFWNFEGMSGMAKTTSDSILGWSGRNPGFWITLKFSLTLC